MSDDPCGTCGHKALSHIHEDGPCRPGFRCPCERFAPPPSDTVTITISREDADYFATDLPASWEEPSVRLKDACQAALREGGLMLRPPRTGETVIIGHENPRRAEIIGVLYGVVYWLEAYGETSQAEATDLTPDYEGWRFDD